MKVVNSKIGQESVKFEDLNEGQCFRFDKDESSVYMKTDCNQDAVSLTDGEYYSNLCDEDVYPVNAEIHIID